MTVFPVRFHQLIHALAVLSLFLATLHAAIGEVKEPSTQHLYKNNNDESKGLTLAGVGVRVKTIGPIKAKVYSVGLYLDKVATKQRLGACKGMDAATLAKSHEFQKTLIEGGIPAALQLRMARSVGTDTMVNALAESVKPRLFSKKVGSSQSESSLNVFQSVLTEALEETSGAKSGTVFNFLSSAQSNQMKVFVNGVQRSTINGDGLCKALLGVYLDKDAVSPSLKKSVAETVSKWL